METEYQRKIRQFEANEAESVRNNAEIDRRHHQQLYDTRQKMQVEVDEMRNRELSTGRKFEIESAGLKMLELQAEKAWQIWNKSK